MNIFVLVFILLNGLFASTSTFDENSSLLGNYSKYSTISELSTDDFVNQQINNFSIERGKDCSKKFIALRLKPNQSFYYIALQKTIANLIPDESYRPTIDLTITLSKQDKIPKTVGLIGGTGPLSDCDILSKIMASVENNVDWNQFAIHLLSAPPPRVFFAVFQGLSYFYNLLNFATLGHDKYYMLGNKAHLHIKWLERVVGCSWLRLWFKKNTSHVVDLVEFVTQSISKKIPMPKVLILEALRSYRSKLYQSYFLKNGLKQDHFYILSEEEATALQTCISDIKANKTESTNQEIERIVIRSVNDIRNSGKEVNTVLCGCTEIPITFRKSWNFENKLVSFGKDSPVFIDTAQIFADKIAEDIKKL